MIRLRSILLVVAWMLGGSAFAQSHLAEGFTRLPAGATIAVMPLDVELFSVTAGGVLEPQAEWTTKAVANLKEALQLRGAGQGGKFVPLPPGDGELLAELNRAIGFFKQPRVWKGIVDRGMREDFSWGASARRRFHERSRSS